MRTTTSRREFVKTVLAGTAGLSLLPAPICAARKEVFAFPLLGDLHYDQLDCHNLEALGREKPDDLRQVREYSSLTAGTLPRLFTSVRETIAELQGVVQLDKLGDAQALILTQEPATKVMTLRTIALP